MDPNACVDRILTALRNKDRDDARDACESLAWWLSRGGFPPRPTAYAEIIEACSADFLYEFEVDLLLSRLRPEDPHE